MDDLLFGSLSFPFSVISVYSGPFSSICCSSLCVRTSRHDLSIYLFFFPVFSRSSRLFLFMPVQIREGALYQVDSEQSILIIVSSYSYLILYSIVFLGLSFFFNFFLPYSCNLYKYLIMAILFIPFKCVPIPEW